MNNRMTSGVIWKQLLIFFFPVVLGSLFQQIYGTVDTIIVGQFVGKTALAAVGGSSSRIVDLLVGFFVGLSSGASVVVAQYYGANNQEKVSKTIHTAIAFCIISGLFVTIMGIFLIRPMLNLLSTPQSTMAGATTYLFIYFLGTVFNLLYNMGAAILRAVGDSKRPLYVLIMTCLLNILLDIIFVVVFQMGIAGVAVATILCQTMSAILVLYMLLKTDDVYQLQLSQIKIHFLYLKKY